MIIQFQQIPKKEKIMKQYLTDYSQKNHHLDWYFVTKPELLLSGRSDVTLLPLLNVLEKEFSGATESEQWPQMSQQT